MDVKDNFNDKIITAIEFNANRFKWHYREKTDFIYMIYPYNFRDADCFGFIRDCIERADYLSAIKSSNSDITLRYLANVPVDGIDLNGTLSQFRMPMKICVFACKEADGCCELYTQQSDAQIIPFTVRYTVEKERFFSNKVKIHITQFDSFTEGMLYYKIPGIGNVKYPVSEGMYKKGFYILSKSADIRPLFIEESCKDYYRLIKKKLG